MKIAAVSDDGSTISQHFGRAPFYIVVTIVDGKVSSREQRDKVGHAQFAGSEPGQGHLHGHGSGHGFDAASQSRHATMAAAISDCEVLLARGMGAGAYQGMQQAGIRPVVTDIASIDEAVTAFLAGTLTDHTERLH
jgi:predicted Fe-Mo cluster-binding NifX family protein